MQTLASWGWRPDWPLPDQGTLGRVIEEQRGLYTVVTEERELKCDLPGRLRHRAVSDAELPAVGDWVTLKPRAKEGAGTILQVLPRRSRVSRRAPGEKEEEQIVAANVDVVFVTTSLNQDFNPRRLERYLTMVRTGGAEPVILLTKADLCPDPGPRLAETRAVAGATRLLAVSAKAPGGLDAFTALLQPSRTHVLVGSSGVGKSTIVNALLGLEAMAVGDVRAHDDRGKHTTSHRELFKLPNGALVIDTPGLREVQLWDADEGLAEAFDDVTALVGGCKFDNCRHETEPGCAVRAAVEAGTLPEARYRSFLKLQRESDRNLPEWEKRRRARIQTKALNQRLKDKEKGP